MLDYARRRGSWPSSSAKWCTSEFKRGPILRMFTALAKDRVDRSRPCRILDCIGLRAQESAARQKKKTLTVRKSTSTQYIETWLPIHHWSESQVWQCIEASKMPVHPAYALGMRRLSCVFCIMAPKAQLELAARENPELLDDYVTLEDEIEHTFKHKFALSQLQPQRDMRALFMN